MVTPFCHNHHPRQIPMNLIMTNHWSEKGGELRLYECPECGHKFGTWVENETDDKNKKYK